MNMVFWTSCFALFHAYAGYPALAWLLARVMPRPRRKAPFDEIFSVVISAHNEAPVLPAKIRSLLASDITNRMSEIVVASDGSTDDTESVVRALGSPRVRFVEFQARRGKAAVLNEVVPSCSGDIIVLTDARQEVAPDALGRLLASFADERIGVVSGELVFRKPTGGVTEEGMDVYWRYEKFIRKQESKWGSVPGATGALYAVRRELFCPIPENILLDDVLIPMQAMAKGCRCVLEEGAVVYDEPSATPAQEAIRKRRTLAGNAQLVRLHPEWLLPWGHPAWFQFVSHKILRLTSPFLLALALASNTAWALVAPGAAVPAVLLVSQAVFYLLAAGGWFCQKRGWKIGWMSVFFVFVALNVTTALAVADAIRGRYNVTWERAGTTA